MIIKLSHSYSTIHAEAPDFVEMSTDQEILVTGIKVVDLLAPYAKGGKIGKLMIITCVICTKHHFAGTKVAKQHLKLSQ